MNSQKTLPPVIRMGNDIPLVWSFFVPDPAHPWSVAYNLTGLSLSLYLVKGQAETKITDYTISGNSLSWIFKGTSQTDQGNYSLTLKVNEGQTGQCVVDMVDFVRLVPRGTSDGNTIVRGGSSCITVGPAINLQTAVDWPYETKAHAAEELAKKVDKVTGKGLSTNDYTDEDKQKVQSALTEHQSLAGYRTAAEQDAIDATKQDTLIAGSGITIASDGKTISADGGGSATGSVRYDQSQSLTDAQKAQARSNINAQAAAISMTYAQLKALRDAGSLAAGQWYRITDYQCTVGSDITEATSAGHQFDIIVKALDASHLSENAYAAHHAGDTYFANSALDAWIISYCLDNDTTRFNWADTTNGKGVIYHMIDEFYNNVPYDFKNIQFYRKWNSSKSLWSEIGDASDGVPAYTFSSEGTSSTTAFTDYSLRGYQNRNYCNVIGKSIYLDMSDDSQELNNNCFFGEYNYHNRFGTNCFYNTFNSSGFNIFGNQCYRNVFGSGCSNNTYGSGCSNNTYGSGCSNNTYGSGCSNNTYGSGCSYNTYGNYCILNTYGSSCSYNTYGNNCSYNIYASDTTGTAGHYFRNIILDDGASYNILYNATTASYSSQVQNYHIKSSMVGNYSVRNIIQATRGLAYDTTIAKNTNGVIVSYCDADDAVDVATSLPATLEMGKVYDLGVQTTLAIVLPASGSWGDNAIVNFLSGSTATSLSISSTAGMSEGDYDTETNKIYQYYIQWGRLATGTMGWLIDRHEYILQTSNE